MNNYPQAVARITSDYLDRLKAQLHLIPAREQDEFLREIQSHVYEAYQQTPGDDEVARILAVLRNLGEPAEVVADRLPAAMVRSGASRNLPLQVLGGVLIALFGIPLGFGGVAVLAGILVSLAAVVVAYYATAGAVLLTGALFLVTGLTRIYRPELWDKLVTLGVIHMDAEVAEFLEHISPTDQGLLMVGLALVLLAISVGLLWLGIYLIRGLRFLFSLGFERVVRAAQSVRRKLRQHKPAPVRASTPSFVK
jgi:uncharacterized membrane protein